MVRIPVSVIVTTRNEEKRIERCLAALQDFDEVLVVDSDSTDNTISLAKALGARVETFSWNGRYPKKRQWCLDCLTLRHEWIFFVDADEEVTSALVQEIRSLFEAGEPRHAGYFVEGLYVMNGKILRHGLRNRKIVLFDRRRFHFPVVDDLDLPGMGEMEGHYQPCLKNQQETIGALEKPLLHHAYESSESWQSRHARYATWEAGMNRKKAWPHDPVPSRQVLKNLFRALPIRPWIAFFHSYVLKAGFLEGREGFYLARDRYRYYRMVTRQSAF